MNETWMKSGCAGRAHWIRNVGTDFFTSACHVVLKRDDALHVDTFPIAFDGVNINVPRDNRYCFECVRQAGMLKDDV
jgi:hypothetical protein